LTAGDFVVKFKWGQEHNTRNLFRRHRKTRASMGCSEEGAGWNRVVIHQHTSQ